MRILHISDLHFSGNENKNIPRMTEYIKNKNIDYCFFTGDLVDKFNCRLDSAYGYLSDNLDISNIRRLFLCCGNHDINRNVVQPMYKHYLNTEISTPEKLNEFIKSDEAGQFKSNLGHIEAYNTLISSTFESDEIHELYSIHKLNHNDKKIVIVSINLAWNAYEISNYGQLLFPDYILTEISKKVNNYDFKILLMHFDSKFLNPDFQKRFNEITYKTFDSIFVGHSHEYENNNISYSSNGIFTSTGSMLKYESNSKIMGFKILEFDLENFSVNVESLLFDDLSITSNKQLFEIPKNNQKKHQIKFHSSILARKENLLDESNRLFLMNRDDCKLNFNDLFVKPILKENSYSDFSIKERKISKDSNIDFENLISENNYIIFGKDKSGKSSLLYKISIDLLDNFNKLNTLPLYIDLNDKSNDDSLDLFKLLKKQYNLSNNEAAKIIKNIKIKVLIDNYCTYDTFKNDLLFSNIETSSQPINLSFLITSCTKINSDFIKLNKNIECKRLFIHTLSRKNIRELTNKWPLKCKQEDAMDKITNILSTMNIGFNFWTVSMFLFILEKTEDFKIRNSSELIELYVEKILDKEKLIIQNKELSYENIKVYLSELAYFLYKKNSSKNYKATYLQLLTCYNELQTKNVRIVADGKSIIDYLVDHGMLVLCENNLYSFRMRGLFEYFLALYMSRNRTFMESILIDPQNYNSFSNEIELYSGMNKSDSNLLNHLFETLKKLKIQVLNNFDKNYEYEELIKEKNEKISNILSVASYFKDSIEPLSYEEQDNLVDSAEPLKDIATEIEVKQIKPVTRYTDYMNCISVLGKSFRNMDDIDDSSLLQNIFRFLLEESCLSIYYVVGEFLKENKEDYIKDSQIKEFEKFILAFAPLLAHSVLYEMISHPTISKLINNEIDELKKSNRTNDVKLFVLYFLLIETNLKDEIDKIEELIKSTSYWNIHNSIFFKLLTFVAFKSNGDELLLSKLKSYLSLVYKKMYPNSNLNEIPKIIRNLKLNGSAELPKNTFDIY